MKSFVSILFLLILTFSAEFTAHALSSKDNKFFEKEKTNLDKIKLGEAENDKGSVVSLERILVDNEKSYSSDFGSAWVWPDFTMELVESYTPFIFRTKSSAQLEEVKVVLNINDKGKLIGYEFLTEVDKGLEERMGHVLRKLPKCLPVPGYSTYEATDFELTIKK